MTRTTIATLLSATFLCATGSAQSVPATILQLDIENWVQYVEDSTDFAKYATNPNATPAAAPRNFAWHAGIADIVAINGQPVKGVMTRIFRNIVTNRIPNPGQGIGDAARSGLVTDTFEILNSSGDAIGTIITSGLAPGLPAPGAPLSVTQGNFAIVGGTGAFLGARGQNGQSVNAQTVPVRTASMTEDPANRRLNGGGRARWVLHLLPMERPEIFLTPAGPAALHSSDSTLVTTTKPAVAGEVLSLLVTGLGPTRPGVDPGGPFPSEAPAVVSPVKVTVNGVAAEVLGATGYPGAIGGYQVNFRVPADAASGNAAIQVTSAWVAGSEVHIAIQ